VIKKKYIYDQYDQAKNRSLYQYSPFHGKKFLNNFFSSRNKLLKKVSENKSNIEKNDEIKFSKKKIIRYCKSFEIKKKIYFDKKQKNEFNLSDYVSLSYKISSYLLNKIDYSMLSTFLKINDLIAYNYRRKKIYNNEKLFRTLVTENLIIKKIIDEKI